ncbi:MAG: VOC family protein [Candidatus Binatia bacterium]
MAKRRLDHASVRISSLERSRDFYEGLLRFTPAPRPEMGIPGVWYQLGKGQLHLIQCDQPAAEGIDPTQPHFAVEVEDLGTTRRELRDAGVDMLDFGGEQLWVRDPDGNTVELRAPAATRK